MSVLYTKEGLKLRKEDFYSIYDKNGVVIDHEKRVINYKGKELSYTKLNKTYINEKLHDVGFEPTKAEATGS